MCYHSAVSNPYILPCLFLNFLKEQLITEMVKNPFMHPFPVPFLFFPRGVHSPGFRFFIARQQNKLAFQNFPDSPSKGLGSALKKKGSWSHSHLQICNLYWKRWRLSDMEKNNLIFKMQHCLTLWPQNPFAQDSVLCCGLEHASWKNTALRYTWLTFHLIL